MKKKIGQFRCLIISGVLLCLIFGCKENVPKNKNTGNNKLDPIPSNQNNKNIAHQILDIEALAGFDIKEATQLLDTILVDCTPKKQLNTIQSLKQIHICLKKHTKKQIPYSPLFSQSLKYRFFDCDILSMLYLGIAEEAKMPLKGLVTNEHMFLQFTENADTFYWETLTGEVSSLQY